MDSGTILRDKLLNSPWSRSNQPVASVNSKEISIDHKIDELRWYRDFRP